MPSNACMHSILEHTYALPNRAKILNLLAAAHRATLNHRDFAERNVVEKDGEYRLIDLRDACEHLPRCRWTYDFEKHIGCKSPRGDDPTTTCGAIEMQAEEMEFWDNGERLQCRAQRYQ